MQLTICVCALRVATHPQNATCIAMLNRCHHADCGDPTNKDKRDALSLLYSAHARLIITIVKSDDVGVVRHIPYVNVLLAHEAAPDHDTRATLQTDLS